MKSGRNWGRLGMKFDITQLCDVDIEVIDGDRGKNYPHQDELFDSGYCLFLSAKNVTQNGFLFGDNQFITQEKDELLNNGNLIRGDIVITTRGTVGNVAIYSDDVPFDNIRINSGMLIIRCGNNIDNYFLYQVLRSKWFYNQIISIQSGSAQPQLPKSHFLKMTIPMPDMETQRKIAVVLSRLGDKISVNTAINENLEQQAQAIFEEWLLSCETEIRIGDLCDNILDYTPCNFENVVLINSSDVTRGHFDHHNLSPNSDLKGHFKKRFKKNDILYSEIRPKNLHYAYCSFEPDNYIASTRLMIIRNIESKVSSSILYRYLMLKNVFEEFTLKTESRSGTFPQGRFEDMANIIVPYSNIEKQKEINSLIENIHNQIWNNDMENQRLSALRDTLLPKLMNGEIDVSEVKI